MWIFGSFSRVFLFSAIHPHGYDDFKLDSLPLNQEHNDSVRLLQNTEMLRNYSSIYRVETYALQGERPYMEDECFVSHDGRLCAIFDGHGGSDVSRFSRSNIFAFFQTALTEYYYRKSCNGKRQRKVWEGKNPDRNTTNTKATYYTTPLKETEVDASSPISSPIHLRNNVVPSTIDACNYALRTALHKLDHEILRVPQWRFQGTTAVAILIHEQGEEPKRHVISANIGDSRAVLSRRGIAIDLSIDHKPNDPNEKHRINKLGGQVDWYGMVDGNTGEPLLDTGVFRINGNLAVSRSLGDKSERPFVSSEPDIKVFPILNDLDEFIVLASDGIFDVMSSQEVVSFLHRHHAINRSSSILPQHNILAKTLAEEAIRRGSLDNVSVIIVWLKII